MITITPSRGDRPRFLEHCIKQMGNQTVKPDEMRIMDYAPRSDKPDLTQRIRKALKGVSGKIAIIEDDDYYPFNYLELVSEGLKTHDCVGFDFSYYYHIRTKKYKYFSHPSRASLFCTSFNSYVLEDFRWPSDEYIFLDIKIWEHIRAKKYTVKWIKPEICKPLGIKHGIGKTGGMGHNKSHLFSDEDKNSEWLWNHTDNESFKFYTTLL